mmetsp:Transcript_50443/g.119984  ORF Transcript_50443/g.119984 Transcript_50443/m.119984 type:complete len:223 (-) Transcript_50443:743-1411(-)
MFLMRFFLANCRLLTSSEALDAKGVMTNETKNAGIPDVSENDDTASTIGSEKRPTTTVPPRSSTAAFLMIWAGVSGSCSSSSSSSSSSSPSSASSADAFGSSGVVSQLPCLPLAAPFSFFASALSSVSQRLRPPFISSKVMSPSPSESRSLIMNSRSASSSSVWGEAVRFACERITIILRSSSRSIFPEPSSSNRVNSPRIASSRISPLASIRSAPVAFAIC